MAITNKEEGVWSIDQVFAKQNQGSIWDYDGSAAAYTWGWNGAGTLGQNDVVQYSSPVQIPGTTWTQIRVTSYSYASFGLKSDGTLWSWGEGDDGMLGQGSQTDKSSPVQIGSDTTWSMIRGHAYGGMATKTDGTLWMWGKNGQGNLGQNNRTKYSSPKQIPGTWSNNFSNHKGVSMAVKADGTLWGWGAQYEQGVLGQNQGGGWYRRSSPVQIPGTTWSQTAGALSVSNEGIAAIKTDGTLWAWGRNDVGRCGPAGGGGGADGGIGAFSSPVQIPGTTWSQVASGNYSIMAIKTNGTLWSWGQNDYGQHGRNNSFPSNSVFKSPLQVGSGTDWSECGCDNDYSAVRSALKTDGTLWVWGGNRYGQLGQNEGPGSATSGTYSSPTQIPGSWAHALRSYVSSGAAQIL
tara:strand:+ start:52 stop:1272 length:1221 start_codon:yes stop_codon:yes gene_type:complete